eukprot:1158022-Pelagomonas_calceolata.AAC.5
MGNLHLQWSNAKRWLRRKGMAGPLALTVEHRREAVRMSGALQRDGWSAKKQLLAYLHTL